MNRINTIKIKITNFCMNNCSFCIFHKRTNQLSFEVVDKIINSIPEIWQGQLVINGGEPTLHKNFIQISELLRNKFPKNRFGLGTNLRIFEKQTKKSTNIFNAIIKNYDLFQIGCDAEHKNIEIVEKLVPIFRHNNKDVYINCIEEYSNIEINKRLKNLDNNFGSKTLFSPVLNHNEHTILEAVNEKQLCKKRQSDILIDADGEIFFCFKQSFEKSLGNVKNANIKELHSIFFETNIDYMYNACYKCSYYE